MSVGIKVNTGSLEKYRFSNSVQGKEGITSKTAKA